MPTATVEKKAHGISAARKKEIAGSLDTALAHLIELSLRAKVAHWNVTGPNFHGLHATFDAVAADARQYADDVAERARALGVPVHATLNDVAKASALGAFPGTSTDWKALTAAVRDDLVSTSQALQELASDIEDDLATQDTLIEVIRGLDKWAWMLDSHLA